MWRFRRSPLVWAALGWVAKACVGMLVVVALFTLFFVWAFGHALAWSVVGCLFAVLPLTGLILSVAVALRAAVAAGPGQVAVRFLGRWRVVNLGDVRVVRFGDQGPLPGFGGFGGFPGFGGPAGFPGFGPMGPRGSGSGDAGGRTLVFEDVHGRRVDIGVDALDAGLAAVVRQGLAPDAEIEPDAARALGQDSEPQITAGDAERRAAEQGDADRP
ncbi:MAG TPA: hypothetical protein VN768_06300 [Acidimicrobiales bacterium]|nr:hypothetical protein [Acidimicrobiales bacterium]